METCLICKNNDLKISLNGNYKICERCFYIKSIRQTLYIKYNHSNYFIDDKCDIVYYYNDENFLQYINNMNDTKYDNIIVENVMNYTDKPNDIIQKLKLKLKNTGEMILITKKFNMRSVNLNSNLNYFNIYSMNILCRDNNLELYKTNSFTYPSSYIFICRINENLFENFIPTHDMYNDLDNYDFF